MSGNSENLIHFNYHPPSGGRVGTTNLFVVLIDFGCNLINLNLKLKFASHN